MQKISTYKALLVFTLAFMLIAAATFAAFRETGEICSQAKNCIKLSAPVNSGEMLWEVVSRQFLTLLAI